MLRSPCNEVYLDEISELQARPEVARSGLEA
jgi:hypothetical protein